MLERDGKWYDRCSDCGGAVVDPSRGQRTNICNDYWDRREWLVKNNENDSLVGPPMSMANDESAVLND